MRANVILFHFEFSLCPTLNKVFLLLLLLLHRPTYQTLVWPCWCIGWFDTVIVSCLVSNEHFSCIVQYFLYHDMDIGTMWHCIGQQRPITVYRTGFCVCFVLVLNVIRCSCYYFLDIILFHHGGCGHHLGFMAIHYFLDYTLGFL